jgi:hypothetical protein
MKKSLIAGIVAAAAVALSIGAAAPANAINTCGQPSPVVPYTSSGGLVNYGASGACSGQFQLMAILYHDFGALPPAAVSHVYVYGSGTTQNISQALCDNGGSTTYYTGGFLYANSTSGYLLSTKAYSAKRVLNHC